jgi:hypothetical protein
MWWVGGVGASWWFGMGGPSVFVSPYASELPFAFWGWLIVLVFCNSFIDLPVNNPAKGRLLSF